MVVAGCTQSLTGYTSSDVERMYGGIYSGLTYYCFGALKQLGKFIDYLNQSALIGILYNLFIIPVSICN